MANFDSTKPVKDRTYGDIELAKLGAEWNDVNPNSFTHKIHEVHMRLEIRKVIPLNLTMGEIT